MEYMIALEKIKMSPIILAKNERGRFSIQEGKHKVNILQLIGVNELHPHMYLLSDGSIVTETVQLAQIEK